MWGRDFGFRQEINLLPEQPGVYLMKDRFDNIIYVGKAVNKNRCDRISWARSSARSRQCWSMFRTLVYCFGSN